MKWSILALSLLAAALHAPALRAGEAAAPRPFLSPLFTSHIVLQRDMRDPVWGWAAPGSRVTVRIAGKSATATAGPDGRWEARIGPFAAGGPYTLSVSGPETVTLDDVLVGDVWLCSGQSNMEMGITQVQDAQREIASADEPRIRLFIVPHSIQAAPQAVAPGGPWRVCTPENVVKDGWGGFSAAGYFFGRQLVRDLGVPIGLLETSFGGTPVESWAGIETLRTLPGFSRAFPDYARTHLEMAAGDPGYESRREAWYRQVDAGSAGDSTWASAALDTSAWKPMRIPTAWEDAGLPGVNGIVWFRKSFNLPPEAVGKDGVLHLSADDRDTAWVNGVKVGSFDLAGIERSYTVPAGILHAGTNTVAVRVLDTGGLGGLNGTTEQYSITVPGTAPILLTGDWLYRRSTPLRDAPDTPIRHAENARIPSVLFNGMVAPLVPFGIKGAIWYQGESNADRAYQYRTLMPALIEDWRARWGTAFPFLQVELAGFHQRKALPGDDDWAELREAQRMTAQRVAGAGIATAVDIGDAEDIHPKNKQEVGRRLALTAEATAYGKHVEFSGPVYRRMERKGSAIRLAFDHVDGGLAARGGKLTGFEIAGADRKFVWADARLDGNAVVASSPDVPEPVAVRYAWQANPDISLYNKTGLPAPPFRTDDWPGRTASSAMTDNASEENPR